MSTTDDVRRILQAAGCDDSRIYSVTSSSSGDSPPPLPSPGRSPWEAPAERQEEKEEREEHKEGQREERKEGEEEEEEEEEKEEGEGSLDALDRVARMEARNNAIRALGRNAAPDDLQATMHQQASIIDRLMTHIKSINVERKDLVHENRLLKRENYAMAHKLASLVPGWGSTAEAEPATTRPQQAPTARDKVHVKQSDSVARGKSFLSNILRNRPEELPHREQGTPVSSPPITREASSASAVIASSSAVDDEGVSPAARASALLGLAQRTPTTRSITPPESTPASVVENTAARAAASTKDAPERATRNMGSMTRAPVGGRMRPGIRSSNHVRETTIPSSRGVGSARPERRSSSRRQPTAASSAGVASYAHPASQPFAPQSRGKRTATATSRKPLDCTRGTVLSRARSRHAITTTGPRGMVF